MRISPKNLEAKGYKRVSGEVPNSIHQGFTLVELVIVMIGILMLILMLLPAVQQVRETARRQACQNNLLQIGIAIGNYESSFLHLPPGCINDNGPVTYNTQGRDISFFVLLQPYLERRDVFEQFDFAAGSYAVENDKFNQKSPPFLQCPSTYADYLNYAGCHHHQEDPIDVDNLGLLFLNSKIRHQQILDGRSNTILLGEKTNSHLRNWMSGTGETLRNTSYIHRQGTFPLFNQLYVGGFDSLHPGGVNFCLADGSIHNFSRDIDPTLFQNLGHRADGAMY